MSFKIRIPDATKEKREYRYTCERCEDARWFVLKLPAHMLTCMGVPGSRRRCGGALVLGEERVAS